MKKKFISLCLVAVFAATAAVGGTLAYFTDTDSATNTFAVGNVQIEQTEKERGLVDGEDGQKVEGLVDFVQNQVLYPAIGNCSARENITVNGYEFKIRDNDQNYIDKIVSVQNTGSMDAYVRTIIAIPNMNGYDDESPEFNPLHWNYLGADDFNNTGWDWTGAEGADDPSAQTDKIAGVKIDSKSYDLYVATYNTALKANAYTTPSLVGFYLDKDVNYGTIKVGSTDVTGYYFYDRNTKTDKSLNEWMTVKDSKCELKILVASQACQTEGFANAWEALDECFGDITASNHPWAN